MLESGATYSFEMSDILIDKDFFGLTQLYTPTRDIKLDVIAISGLNGHAYGSWAGRANNAGRKKMWLRHFFEKDRPECRTMIYGYNSRLSEHCVHRLSDYSRGLLEEIDKARKGCEERPIALIGHSFGGIIIADAIVRDKKDPRRGNLFKMTKAIVFFATPHRGILFDDIVEMVGEESPRLDLVHAIGIGQDAEHLISFTKYAEEEHFAVMSFQEMKQTRKAEKNSVTGKWARTGEHHTLVDRESSILKLPWHLEDVQSAEGDHSSLVKFDHQLNHSYTTLRDRLKVLLSYINQASGKDPAETNTKLRLAVLKNEHQLVSVLLTLGCADPNAEEHQCSMEGRSLSPAISTKDIRILGILLRHGAKINLENTHPGYAALSQGRGDDDDPFQQLRKRPEEEVDLNHSKRRGVVGEIIQNTSGISRRDILTWLSTHSPEDDHERIYSKRHGNTGKWFLESTEVQEWLEGLESTLLWCYGNPGVGKSVLTSTLLESIKTKYEHDNAIGIACFYFSFQITVNQEPQDVLRVWIKQLCRRMDELPGALCALYKACVDDDMKPKRCQLEDIFQKVVNHFKQVFLVIDALDECGKESRNDLVNYLGQVSCRSSCKIFIASRREVDIERNILSAKFAVLPIQVTKVDEDIAVYVDHELESRNQDYCAIRKGLKGAIRARLIQQANGMFLWVKCQLDFIYDQPSEKDIRDALDCLPTTMHDTYDRILKRINQQAEATRKLAHRALAWVITAKRPLTIEELVLAVAVEPTTKCCEELHGVYSQNVVISSCCGLVTSDCGTVRPIHFTVQEFLRARGLDSLDGLSMSNYMAQSIFTYLCSLSFEIKNDFHGAAHIVSRYALGLEIFKYACCFLGSHLREAENPLPDYLLNLVRCLMGSQSDYDVLRWAILAVCGNREGARLDEYHVSQDHIFQEIDALSRVRVTCGSLAAMRSYSLSPLGLFSGLDLLPLYFQLYPDADIVEELNDVLNDVARGGSVSAMTGLLDRGCDINYRDYNGSTPLITAVTSGFEKVALFLLERGADVHLLNKQGRSALYYASKSAMVDAAKRLLERGAVADLHWSPALHAGARSGSVVILRLLLEHGADVDLMVEDRNALYHAVENVFPEIVKMLLDAGADVNLRTRDYGTALQVATRKRNPGIVKMLLDAGADVNLQGGTFGTALQVATFNADVEIVKMLLDAGADVDLQGGRYGTALQAAAYQRSPEMVKLFLDAGADIDRQGGKYGTALQAAAYNSSPEMVKMLLDADADVDVQGGDYGTALQAAASNPSSRIVKVPLDADVAANPQGWYFGTALQCGAYECSPDMFTMSLDSCLEVNLQEERYGNALKAAAHNDSREIVKILLDAGADVDLQGGKYGTALQAAANKDSPEIVQMLLDAGADVDLQGGKYGTALQAAANKDSPEIVQMLLDAGADIDLQGGEYGTTLQAAAYQRSPEMVKMLLDAGADVNLQGGQYGTALQAAAYQRSPEIVKMLLDAGADVDLEGGKYGTTLQAAAYNSSPEMVKMLLDADADVDVQGGDYGTALQAAASNPSSRIVKVPLDADVAANPQGWYFGTALQCGAYECSPDMFTMSLDSCLEVNPQEERYGNALKAAAHNDSREIVKILLDAGADVDLQGGKYGTALQAAANKDSPEIVQMLLDAGADIDLQGGEYGTTLQAAAYQRSPEMVKMLLDAGADVNLQGGQYGTALQAAAYQRSSEIVKMLLDAGADVDLEGGKYGTTLQAAAYNSSPEIVKMLLDAGADVDLQGGEYGTALQAAAGYHKDRPETVRMLLDAGAAANLQGGYFGTALQAAAYRGSPEIVKTLLDAGADVNLQGGEYGTALQAAASFKSDNLDYVVSTVNILLKGGADINIRGGRHGSAREAAAKHSPSRRILRILDAAMEGLMLQ
ncbi:ankyrin repeat-containing domain protein [Morchella snyderi]|nr:ankyrin repeat-containing domain protein [Morchella snyderi]